MFQSPPTSKLPEGNILNCPTIDSNHHPASLAQPLKLSQHLAKLLHLRRLRTGTMENTWKIHGKYMENHGKYMENHGKYMESIWKTIKIHGKYMENHQNTWKTMEKGDVKNKWKR